MRGWQTREWELSVRLCIAEMTSSSAIFHNSSAPSTTKDCARWDKIPYLLKSNLIMSTKYKMYDDVVYFQISCSCKVQKILNFVFSGLPIPRPKSGRNCRSYQSRMEIWKECIHPEFSDPQVRKHSRKSQTWPTVPHRLQSIATAGLLINFNYFSGMIYWDRRRWRN